MLSLLSFPVSSVDVVVIVVMGWHCRHLLLEVVLVVVEVLLWLLPVLAVVLHDIVVGVVMEIVQ